MGEANEALDLKTTPPAIMLMAGLQGVRVKRLLSLSWLTG